jgi:DNA-binding CsgD family transcriptional regulator
VARAARGLPRPPGLPATLGDRLLDADAALQLDGLDAAAPLLRRAIEAVRGQADEEPELFRQLAAACAAATILADEPLLRELSARMEAAARQHGPVYPLALALSHAGVAGLLRGDLAEAGRCFTERTAQAEALGQPWSIGPLLLAAWRGPARRAYDLLDTVGAEASAQGQGYQLAFAGYARCVLELGLGHYEAAYASLRVSDTSPLKFALPDLVEAAQRAGQADAAAELTGRLARLAQISPSPVMAGFLARARALTAADDPRAEEHYQQAISLHAQAGGPAHLARSQLVYGEWLRRARRPGDARASLRAARQVCTEIGATGFAQRAGRELSAAGEAPPALPPPRPGHDLTPQEAQVARLAAAGATNAEIAAQLYLSPNTVDYHLRKVFRKLSLTSRRQLTALRDSLPAGGS